MTSLGWKLRLRTAVSPPGPTNPVVVRRTLPGSAAAEAGFQTDDIIRKIDGAPVETPYQFSQAIARHLAQEVVRIAITRGSQQLDLSATLKARPLETSPNADVLYRSVVVRDARRRVVITRPNRPG